MSSPSVSTRRAARCTRRCTTLGASCAPGSPRRDSPRSEPMTDDEMLRRMLGPKGPEVTCEVCFEGFDGYVEAELAPGKDADAQIPGMREHFEVCPACAEEHASLRALLER